ncbi:hypothetical protein L6R53_05020 [Myxococcota bacterium]|jgi:hypothetical protein|nr:hypothetical protein [Myxococcota bacterium]
MTAHAPSHLAQRAAAADPSAALDRARELLAVDLRRLGLPAPVLVLDEAAGLLAAQVDADDLRITAWLPLSGSGLPTAELATRLDLPAPASAVLTRQGWRPHPDQDQDELAAAFLAVLEERPELVRGLRWAEDDPAHDWLVQVVADQADACLIVVRTAPVGPMGDRAGLGAFLDLAPLLRHLVRRWTLPVSLPLGAARPCLAVEALTAEGAPTGEPWTPEWRLEAPVPLVPDALVEEEDPDDLPTELEAGARPPHLVEVEPSEVLEAVVLEVLAEEQAVEVLAEEQAVQVPADLPAAADPPAPPPVRPGLLARLWAALRGFFGG